VSYRYGASYLDPGLNTLVAPTPSYTYYLNTWGLNTNGQLGLGTTTNYSSPKQVGSLTNWLSVVGGLYHSIALKTDGTIWTWGFNNFGQLGIGNTTPYSSPKQVGALTNWSVIASGANSSFAIKKDGSLWCWGANNSVGQLGLGNTTSYSSPKQVGSLTNWAYISSGVAQGVSTTMAIKTDGTLWAWGSGNNGQLGLNNTINYSSPKQVGSLTNWAKVSSGFHHTVAIKTDGTIWSWGQGTYSCLGLGNNTNYSSPKQIGLLTNWLNVACGTYDSYSIKTDGTLWAWGYNGSGELGNGTLSVQQNSPVQIGALTNWLSIAGGNYFVAAVQTNGALYTWGQNGYGQLGLGNTNNYSSPKQVGSLTNWRSPSCNGGGSMLALQY